MGARLSTADTAWLHMDRPTNLMVINAVELFDEPPDFERIKQIIQSRLVDRYPRFRQRVVESRLPLRTPRWEDDPDYALEHHVHHLALPPPGDRAALQVLVGDLMTMPLDRNRPLWHTYLVEGFGGGSAIIYRIHHCMAWPRAGQDDAFADRFGPGCGNRTTVARAPPRARRWAHPGLQPHRPPDRERLHAPRLTLPARSRVIPASAAASPGACHYR